jgi:hypothetical protein
MLKKELPRKEGEEAPAEGEEVEPEYEEVKNERIIP